MPITRREFIKAAGGFVCATVFGHGQVDAAKDNAGTPPNILFLITDQHNSGVLGCAGNPIVKTPHLDRLAAEGARFTNAVCATPFCSPTRASLVTGQWPHTHGIVKNIDKNMIGLKDNTIGTEQLLFDSGYVTRQMGKWHLGNLRDLRCYNDDEEDALSQEAFRKWLQEQPRTKWHKARKNEVVEGEVAFSPEMYKFHLTWSRQKKPRGQDLSIIGRSLRPPELTFEWWLTEQCIALIRKYKHKNFMITWSVNPPHPLWVVPDPYYSMYDPAKIKLPPNWHDRPEAYKDSQPAQMGRMMGETLIREYLRCYYGLVTMIDDCIGRILKALKEEGLEQKTLVLFTSDHGDMQGGHGMPCKSLPAFYEEIIRVPLIVRYPGQIRHGSVVSTHVGSVDIMPTFLDYTNVPVPKSTQGVSLRPLLEGKVSKDDRPAFCERGIGDTGTFSRMIRTREWKYCVFADGRKELFNLAHDPWEMTNLADSKSHSADQMKLHRMLIEQMEKTSDPALRRIART